MRNIRYLGHVCVGLTLVGCAVASSGQDHDMTGAAQSALVGAASAASFTVPPNATSHLEIENGRLRAMRASR